MIRWNGEDRLDVEVEDEFFAGDEARLTFHF